MRHFFAVLDSFTLFLKLYHQVFLNLRFSVVELHEQPFQVTVTMHLNVKVLAREIIRASVSFYQNHQGSDT